ncbi:MAG: SdpI family protein [Roseburia sp.]|nr:SdpI family protein [Roseburia sp.]
MGFWVFMLISDLLMPVVMIGFGRVFLKHPPKEINGIYGYRTAMSMKNKETWEFAHKYCGKLWYICGLALLPVTIAAMLPVLGKSEDAVGTVGGILCVIQTILLIGSIFPTERALRRTFDKQGNRKTGV